MIKGCELYIMQQLTEITNIWRLTSRNKENREIHINGLVLIQAISQSFY